MKNNDILIRLGLTDEESAVYLTLLRQKALSVSDIALKTKLYRPAVYKALPSLLGKCLVATTKKGKRTLYAALSPEKLASLLSDMNADLENVLPEMLSLFEKKEKRPLVTFLEGRDGIRTVFRDIAVTLKKGDVFYRYSSSKKPREKNYYVPHDYVKLRDQKQLERFVITNAVAEERKKPRLEKSVKIVPKSFDLFEYDTTELIYADKIAFVDYNTETAITIENQKLAQFQKKIFKLLFMKL